MFIARQFKGFIFTESFIPKMIFCSVWMKPEAQINNDLNRVSGDVETAEIFWLLLNHLMLQLSLGQLWYVHECECTNLIPVRGGGYWVLSSQCYTTSGYDQQDGHFKVPEVHHVVTRSAHPEGEQKVRGQVPYLLRLRLWPYPNCVAPKAISLEALRDLTDITCQLVECERLQGLEIV